MVPRLERFKNPAIVIMHDREKGLPAAQAQVLPEPHESACLRHLEANLRPIAENIIMDGRVLHSGRLLWRTRKPLST